MADLLAPAAWGLGRAASIGQLTALGRSILTSSIMPCLWLLTNSTLGLDRLSRWHGRCCCALCQVSLCVCHVKVLAFAWEACALSAVHHVRAQMRMTPANTALRRALKHAQTVPGICRLTLPRWVLGCRPCSRTGCLPSLAGHSILRNFWLHCCRTTLARHVLKVQQECLMCVYLHYGSLVYTAA